MLNSSQITFMGLFPHFTALSIFAFTSIQSDIGFLNNWTNSLSIGNNGNPVLANPPSTLPKKLIKL